MAYNRTYLSTLKEYAFKYIDECEGKRKEQLSNKGEIVKVEDRKMPTIDYFLLYWLPKNCKKNKTISRSTYFRWVNWENSNKQKVMLEIDNLLKAIQLDIVANEGKGIQFVKHKFGWTDKQQTDINVTQLNANFGTTIQPASESGNNTQLDK